MVRMPRPQLSILESHNIHLHRRKLITFLDSCAVLAFVAAECPTMQKHVRKGGLKKAASHLAAFMQDGYFECQSGRTERCLFLRSMIRETRRNSWSFFTLRSQHCSNELKEGCCLSFQASDPTPWWQSSALAATETMTLSMLGNRPATSNHASARFVALRERPCPRGMF